MRAPRCRWSGSRWAVGALAGLVCSCIAIVGDAPAQAASLIQVTGTADETTVNGVCSLREAVLAANLDQPVDTCAAGSGFDEIVLPLATYALTIGGAGEQAARTGDLDLASSTTIIGNRSIIDAGGLDRAIEVLPGAEVSVVGVTIRNGYMQMTGLTGTEFSGGGIYNDGKLSLTDASVSGNIADFGEFGGASGAGIGSDGELTMLPTTVSGNSLGFTYPSGNGGGVFNRGALTVVDSSISGNAAFDRGGGIFNGGTAMLEGSTVSGNSTGCYECDAAGGGIASYGDLQVTNSTISGNSADAGDYSGSAAGGGLDNGGTAQLVNVTIANNSVGKVCGSHCFAEVSGGGISNSGSLSIANTIVSGDSVHVDTREEFGGGSVTTPWDCAGTVVSQGYNLIGVSAGCNIVASTGDLLDVDPLLGPLQDNGGPAATRTHDLGAGSPAIDAGDPAAGGCPTTDQRGVTRPLDGNLDGVVACDIGAIETGIAHDTGDLLQNGSFEASDGLLHPWIFRHDVAATADVDTAEHVDGSESARVTVAATSTSTHLVQLRQEGIELQAGARYTVRFWARSSVPRVINARLQSPLAPYPTFKARNFTLTTRWQRFEFSYTSPRDVADAFVGFNLAQSTGTVWLDQVTLYNDSNLVTNGGFDDDDSTIAPWIWRNDINASLVRDTTVKFRGAASARVTVPTVGSASHLVQLRVPVTTLETGRTYLVSFEIKGSRARLANVRLQSSDAPYPTLVANNFNVSTDWTHISFEWTPKRVVTHPFLGFNLAQDTGSLWIDNVALTAVAVR